MLFNLLIKLNIHLSFIYSLGLFSFVTEMQLETWVSLSHNKNNSIVQLFVITLHKGRRPNLPQYLNAMKYFIYFVGMFA